MSEPGLDSSDALDALVARQPVADFPLAIDASHVAAFHDDGFTSVARITTDEELAWLGEIYDHLFGARVRPVPGGYFDLARPYESEGEDQLPQILAPELAVPALRRTAFWRNGRAIAAALLGVDAKDLRGWGHMTRKPARIGAPLPWANEWQLPPTKRDEPAVRPWLDAGRRAWESRRIE